MWRGPDNARDFLCALVSADISRNRDILWEQVLFAFNIHSTFEASLRKRALGSRCFPHCDAAMTDMVFPRYRCTIPCTLIRLISVLPLKACRDGHVQKTSAHGEFIPDRTIQWMPSSGHRMREDTSSTVERETREERRRYPRKRPETRKTDRTWCTHAKSYRERERVRGNRKRRNRGGGAIGVGGGVDGA